MFYVYMLHCADGSYYVGHTDNLDLRIAQHSTGEYCAFTSKRRPTTLVYSQPCSTRYEALSAERQIKGWSRAKKQALINGDWKEISRLAKSRSALRQAQGERE